MVDMATAFAKISKEFRSAQRYPTRLEAWALYKGNTIPLSIVNISNGGAMVDGVSFLRVGTTVRLRAHALDVIATVVWAACGRSGLRFDGDVDPLEVVRQNYAGLEHFRSARARLRLEEQGAMALDAERQADA
jgi:hypothetical protein